MKTILQLLTVFCLLTGGLSAMPIQKMPDAKAKFKASDLALSFMLVDSKWRGGKFRDAVTEKLSDGGVKTAYQVDFGTANGSFNVTLLPVRENPDAFQVTAKCHYPEGVSKGVRALNVEIPVNDVVKLVLFQKGKNVEVKFPKEFKKMEL